LGAVQIDGTRLAVAGASAGGMCAFLAAVHANPKPCAVLSIYGLGGNLLVSFLPPHSAATPTMYPRVLNERTVPPCGHGSLHPST
jgi:acetyl esterase/lipase